MNDLAEKLSLESDDSLRRRRSNARRLATDQPDTPLGQKAEQQLLLIEAELELRSLPGNITTFLAEFPLGFRDPKHLDQEWTYKDEASSYCQEHLGKSAFDAIAAGGPIDDLLHHVCKLVGKTNLIQGSFEKPKLLDAINDPKNSRIFLDALGELLHGSGEPSSRIDAFSDALAEVGLSRKWTYTTYFLFLSDPAHCLFVKPEGLKRALEITNYPLTYESAPTGRHYAEILKFANWLKDKLIGQGRPELTPDGMIDVQSFMWHLAPTGKYAR